MRKLQAIAVVSRPVERLPLLREDWPEDARRAWRELLQQLGAWSRERGTPGSHDPELAEEAVREAWESSTWRTVRTRPAVPPEPARLSNRLRSWPAEWRYRVAELERAGVGRREAIAMVRQEHRHAAGETTRLCA